MTDHKRFVAVLVHRTDLDSSRMSAGGSSPPSVVGHIVLFDIKPETGQEKVETMISRLRSLSSLDSVLFLTAGRITRLHSDSFGFTHLLFGLYRSRESLAEYSAHPAHLAVVRDTSEMVRDIMAIDWVAALDADAPPPIVGSAFRLSLVKPRPDLEDRLDGEAIGTVLDRMRRSFRSAIQVSAVENFSPSRAKGFDWGFISFFRRIVDIDALNPHDGIASTRDEQIGDLVDGVIVVDYGIPRL